MENLLNPDTGLIIWTIISFAILVLLLGKVAWKPLLKALKDREDGIRKAIEDASCAKQSADQLQVQLQQELAKAEDQAANLIIQAQAEAQKVRENMLKETDAEVRRLMDQMKRQLDEEKSKLSRELRQEIAGLSVRVAEKLLKHSMNAKENAELVQGFIKDLEQQNN